MALITDGRFSGGTRGFCVGHVGPEAAVGGPIGLLRDGDMIAIDAIAGTLSVELSDAELASRRAAWQPRENEYQSGALWRYGRNRRRCREGRGHPSRRARRSVLLRRHLGRGMARRDGPHDALAAIAERYAVAITPEMAALIDGDPAQDPIGAPVRAASGGARDRAR